MRADGEPLVTPPPEAAGPRGCQTSELSSAAGLRAMEAMGKGWNGIQGDGSLLQLSWRSIETKALRTVRSSLPVGPLMVTLSSQMSGKVSHCNDSFLFLLESREECCNLAPSSVF